MVYKYIIFVCNIFSKCITARSVVRPINFLEAREKNNIIYIYKQYKRVFSFASYFSVPRRRRHQNIRKMWWWSFTMQSSRTFRIRNDKQTYKRVRACVYFFGHNFWRMWFYKRAYALVYLYTIIYNIYVYT